MVHGHAYPPIVEAAQRQAERGTGWAGGNRNQLDLAEQIVTRVASVDQVRFTNSGSEAASLAFTIARKVTGRPKLLMARHESGPVHGAQGDDRAFYCDDGCAFG